MRKLFPPLAALVLVLICAAPAQAEKWLWFPIKGGAVAYDEDSRNIDLATGEVGADTLIYYDRPRPIGNAAYSFVAERLQFECRGTRHRWSQSAVLDLEGAIVVAREDGDWTPLGTEMGSAALFKRMLCLTEVPPNGKQAADLDATLKAIKEAAPRVDLAAVAIPPATARTAPPVAPPPAAPPPVRPPVQAAPPATPIVTALKTPEKAAASANVPPVVTLPPPAPPPATTLTYAPPPASAAGGYETAPRCVLFREDNDLSFRAVNSCAYRVNYAWCIAGGRDPAAECKGPAFARGYGAVAPRSESRTAYIEGVGRTHVFACRAPGLPRVKETGPGRYDYDCAGDAPPVTAAAAPPPAPKVQPKVQAERPGPKLRR